MLPNIYSPSSPAYTLNRIVSLPLPSPLPRSSTQPTLSLAPPFRHLLPFPCATRPLRQDPRTSEEGRREPRNRESSTQDPPLSPHLSLPLLIPLLPLPPSSTFPSLHYRQQISSRSTLLKPCCIDNTINKLSTLDWARSRRTRILGLPAPGA